MSAGGGATDVSVHGGYPGLITWAEVRLLDLMRSGPIARDSTACGRTYSRHVNGASIRGRCLAGSNVRRRVTESDSIMRTWTSVSTCTRPSNSSMECAKTYNRRDHCERTGRGNNVASPRDGDCWWGLLGVSTTYHKATELCDHWVVHQRKLTESLQCHHSVPVVRIRQGNHYSDCEFTSRESCSVHTLARHSEARARKKRGREGGRTERRRKRVSIFLQPGPKEVHRLPLLDVNIGCVEFERPHNRPVQIVPCHQRHGYADNRKVPDQVQVSVGDTVISDRPGVRVRKGKVFTCSAWHQRLRAVASMADRAREGAHRSSRCIPARTSHDCDARRPITCCTISDC
jgi:hypothetical protein